MSSTRHAALPALLLGFAVLVLPASAQTTGGPAPAAAPAPASPAPASPTPAAAVPPPAAAPTPAAAATLPQDLSFWGMISGADWIVKGVIAGLAFASVLTWTVALAKALELLLNARAATAGLRALKAAPTLEDAATRVGTQGTCAHLVAAVRAELDASSGLDADGTKERAAWKLDRIVAKAGRVLGRGTGVLATIGSTAPFVGLFGTVWGIMNAFIGISKSQTTNLAVVAPGIAEALLATAIGLVAAIPAVVIYNLCARATAAARAQMADAVAETMRLLSRDLDRRTSRAPRLQAAE